MDIAPWTKYIHTQILAVYYPLPIAYFLLSIIYYLLHIYVYYPLYVCQFLVNGLDSDRFCAPEHIIEI